MKKHIAGIIFILFAGFACGAPAQPNLDIAVTQTLQALSSLPPASPMPESSTQIPAPTVQADSVIPDGETVSVGGISFLLPNGMASDTTSTSTTEVEFPYINPSLGEMPQHTKIILNNYPAQGTIFQPQIMVFNAAEYSQYSEMTTQIVSVMHNMQYIDGQPLPQGLPDGSIHNAQILGITFQNGKGIRYITQFDQSFMPANNRELIYYFHGITTDGQYYIQAILPVQAPFLPLDGNPNTLLPAEGIPFNMDDFAGYNNAIAQKLNATDGFSFTPYLEHLDSMMESLLVTGL